LLSLVAKKKEVAQQIQEREVRGAELHATKQWQDEHTTSIKKLEEEKAMLVDEVECMKKN